MTFDSGKCNKVKVTASSFIKSSASLWNCKLNNAVRESYFGMLVNGKEFGNVNSSKWQIDIPNNESIVQLSDARKMKVVEDNKLQGEPSSLPSRLSSPLFLLDDKMSTTYSRHNIDLDEPDLPQVEECMDISPLQASNTLCACETLSKPGEVERARKIREEEDAQNPSLHTPIDFQAIESRKVIDDCLEEQHKVYKRSFSKKQKQRQNYHEKRHAEDKRDKYKEIRGKPVSTSLKVSSPVQQQELCFNLNSYLFL